MNREGNDYTVPKRDLVSATQVLFQCGRLKAPPIDELPLGRVFVEERKRPVNLLITHNFGPDYQTP